MPWPTASRLRQNPEETAWTTLEVTHIHDATNPPAPEEHACDLLSALLVSAENGESLLGAPELHEVLSFLELFAGWALVEAGQGDGGIDGVEPVVARRVSERGLLVTGWAFVLEAAGRVDRVPIRLRVQIDAAAREVEWMTCELDVDPDWRQGRGARFSGKQWSDRAITERLLEDGEIEWRFGVEYGDGRA